MSAQGNEIMTRGSFLDFSSSTGAIRNFSVMLTVELAKSNITRKVEVVIQIGSSSSERIAKEKEHVEERIHSMRIGNFMEYNVDFAGLLIFLEIN